MSVRQHVTRWMVAVLAATLLSCADAPAGPAGQATVSMNFLTPATIREIVVEVTGPGIDPAVIVNVPVGTDSTARGTLVLSAGSARRFVISAVDSAGITTHRADTTVTLVAGTNPTLAIRLDPLDAALAMTVTFGGVRMTVADTSTRLLAPGDSVALSALAIDAAGDTVPADSLVWGSSSPATMTVSRGVVRALRQGIGRVTVSYRGAAIPIGVRVGGAPSQLVILAQPTDGTAGGALTPLRVEVLDSAGTRVVAYDGPVSLTIAENPTATWILGDTVVNAVRGVATFDAVSVGLPGSGYRLRASAGTLPPVTTAPFAMSVPTVIADESSIGAYGGVAFYCALGASGEPYCWGLNTFGGLGTGDQADRAAPTPVVGGLRFRSIAVGNGHACGVTAGDDAYCWGRNVFGQLGDGTTTLSTQPVLVGGGYRWRLVDAGTLTTCGLTDVGQAYCWGYNDGRMGTGDSTHRASPTPVAAPVRFTSLSVGAFSACGVTAGGWTYCWGVNFGRFGNGSRSSSTRPVRAGGNLRFAQLNVADLGGAPLQSPLVCGVTIRDETYCWGAQSVGQLGRGTAPTDTAFSPVPAMSGVQARRLVTAEGMRTCALDAGGQLYCSGTNAGAFGSGDAFNSVSPVAAVGSVRFSEVATARSSSCGIATTGVLYCWGLEIPGGNVRDGAAPARIASVPEVERIAIGKTNVANPSSSSSSNHLCALTPAGAIACWGQNIWGQTGSGLLATPQVTPIVVDAGQSYRALATARDATCAVTVAGVLRCWGANGAEILGRPRAELTSTRVPVTASTTLSFTSLVAGVIHMCGIATDASTYCWGSNNVGQGGTGDTSTFNAFRPVTGGLQFSQLVSGNQFTCGLAGTGMYCWGFGNPMRGFAGGFSSTTPLLVSGAEVVSSIAAGGDHACFVTAAGAARCWGLNSAGQVGDGSSTTQVLTPSPVAGGLIFTALAAGSDHTCGLTGEGVTYCWGSAAFGQLGPNPASRVPLATFPDSRFASIAAGGANTCGITATRALFCWGTNSDGQLDTALALEPATFSGLSGLKVRSLLTP